MKVRQCPECKNEISEAVEFCSYCGCSLKEKEEISYENEKSYIEGNMNDKIVKIKKTVEKNIDALKKLTAVMMLIVGLFNATYIFSYLFYLFDDIIDTINYGWDIWVIVDAISIIEFMALVSGVIITAIVLLKNKYKELLRYTPILISVSYILDAIVTLIVTLKYGIEFSDFFLIILRLAVAGVWMVMALRTNNKNLKIHVEKNKTLMCIACVVISLEFIRLIFFANPTILSFVLLMAEYSLPILFIIISDILFENSSEEKMITGENYSVIESPQSIDNITGYLKVWKLIIFSILTFGIYTYIWIYHTVGLFNSKKISEEKSQSVQVVLCLFIPFYIIYWLYKQSKQTEEYTLRVGNPSNDLSVISLVLSILGFGLIAMALIQDQINKNIIKEISFEKTDIEKIESKVISGEKPIIYNNVPVKSTYMNEQSKREDRLSDVDIEYLKKIKELLDMGILTEEEYKIKKDNVVVKQ